VTWLGIDFSGNHLMWSARCSRSNVWIAEVSEERRRLRLRGLRRVQELPGDGTPFARLAHLLSLGDFDAAAIDASFSVPARFAAKGHAELLEQVARIERRERPFPAARDFVRALTRAKPGKPLRECEKIWKISTRSALWAGARGGAAMTAACLTLLHETRAPIWPWTRKAPGLLVEGFPAAQLKVWGLPHTKYGDQRAARALIVRGLEQRLSLGRFKAAMLDSADALDAVVCAFAARAAAKGTALGTPARTGVEGWISVHP
jgi:hypothetical protein